MYKAPIAGYRHKAITLAVLPLCLAVFLGKFSLPTFSRLGLGVALPILLVVTAVGFVCGKFEIVVKRFLLYLILIAWIGAIQLVRANSSLPSFIFLVLLHAPLVLRLRVQSPRHPREQDSALIFFSNLGFCLAILGAVQFWLQYVTGPVVAFPIEHLLPNGFLTEGYNHLNILNYGSTTFKSNGIFFLEPSLFSQFTAIALLIELSIWNRPIRIIGLALGLISAFSGTGVVVLASGLAVLIISKRRLDLIGLLIASAIFAFLFQNPLKLDIFFERATEFSDVGTSGFERFVSWTYLLREHFLNDTLRIIFGAGTGSFDPQQQVARYGVASQSFSKAIFEFGIPGATIYFIFLFESINTAQAPVAVKFGAALAILMAGSYSETIAGILLSLLLWPSSSAKSYKRHIGSLAAS